MSRFTRPPLAALALLAAFVAPAESAPDRRVLVLFREPPGAGELALVAAAGGVVRHRFTLVPAVAATLPPSAAARLLMDPRVRSVEDEVVYAAAPMARVAALRSPELAAAATA